MIPPDLATFWAQVAQQGLNPKVVTLGKARLFPSIIETLGPRGDGLTSEIWWMPSRPFAFCLTGRSAKDQASAYTAATGRPWTQVPGFIHALLELSMGVIKRTVALDVAADELPGVLGPTGISRRSGGDLSDHAGRAGHCHHAVGARGDLGAMVQRWNLSLFPLGYRVWGPKV